MVGRSITICLSGRAGAIGCECGSRMGRTSGCAWVLWSRWEQVRSRRSSEDASVGEQDTARSTARASVYGLSDSVEYRASSVERRALAWPMCEVSNRKGRGAVRHAKPPTSTRVFGLDSAPFSLPPHYARTLACTLSLTHVHTRTHAGRHKHKHKKRKQARRESLSVLEQARASGQSRVGKRPRRMQRRGDPGEPVAAWVTQGRRRRRRWWLKTAARDQPQSHSSEQRAASGVDGGVCRSGAALRGGGGGERGLISPCVVLRGWHPPPPGPGPYPFFKLPMSLPVPSPLPASLPLSEWPAGAYRIVGMGLTGGKLARGVGSHGWRTDHGQSRDKDEWPTEYGIETCRQRLASGRDSFRP